MREKEMYGTYNKAVQVRMREIKSMHGICWTNLFFAESMALSKMWPTNSFPVLDI
jgi:hypothetical protein